jgi:hypothetical protein
LIVTATRQCGHQDGEGKKDRDPETHAGPSGREPDDWRKSEFAGEGNEQEGSTPATADFGHVRC